MDKIHDNLGTLRLDNTDTSFIINRIRTAFPKASFNKVMSLESVMRISSEKGYDYLKNQFRLSSSQLSRLKKEIQKINEIPESRNILIFDKLHLLIALNKDVIL